MPDSLLRMRIDAVKALLDMQHLNLDQAEDLMKLLGDGQSFSNLVKLAENPVRAAKLLAEGVVTLRQDPNLYLG